MFELKYLFEATFADGTKIRQDAKDQSQLDEKRSRFHDVQQFSNAPLRTFSLSGPEGCFLVDLSDGHFEINGATVWLQPMATDTMPAGGRYELIYCRDHVVFWGGRSDHLVSYRIGWNYRADGQTFTQSLVVR